MGAHPRGRGGPRNPLAAAAFSEGECRLAAKAGKGELCSRPNRNGCYVTVNILLGIQNKHALKIKSTPGLGWRRGWGVTGENGSLPLSSPVAPHNTSTSNK